MVRERVGRPSGEPYSSDARTRYAQLVADGRLGAPGSELARRNAARGGRRPRRPPVDVDSDLRAVLLAHPQLRAHLLDHERDAERLRARADRLRRVAHGLR